MSNDALCIISKLKCYINCGGCQTGRVISITSEGRKLFICLFTGTAIVNDELKWVIVKPAQQVQWQKGEHASLLWLSCWWETFVSSVFGWLSIIALVSAQGITLSAKTRIAIMKAKNFIGCEGKEWEYKLKLKSNKGQIN